MIHSRTFKFSIYLMVFAGILAIVSAEETMFYLVLFLLASVLSWFLVDKSEIAFLPGRPAMALVGICFLFSVADMAFVSGTALLALEHFMMLTLVVKLFQRKSRLVLGQIYILCFLLVLNSAALTQNVSFLVVLIYYLTILTFSLSLYFIKAENHRFASMQDRFATRFDAPGGLDLFLSRSYFHFTVGLSLLVMFMTVFFFLLIPRFGDKPDPGEGDGVADATVDAGGLPDIDIPLGGDGLPGRPTADFATGIDFDSMGAPMKMDPTVVVRVRMSYRGRPVTAAEPLRGLYFRGVNINLPGEFPNLDLMPETALPDARDGFEDGWVTLGDAGLPASRVECRLEHAANATQGMLLLLDPPVAVKTAGLSRVEPDLGYRLPADAGAGVLKSYTTTAGLLPLSDGVNVGSAAHPDPLYVQLPAKYDARALRLFYGKAVEALDAELSDYDRVQALEAYLRANYSYSTAPHPMQGDNPVEDFLFYSKRGWCEHFASAMMLTLRSVGLPARIVGGFRGGEWNAQTDRLELRRSDAHAWVEVHFQNAGWLRFDPTPGEDRLQLGGPRPEAVLDDPNAPENIDQPELATDTPEEIEAEQDDRTFLERFFIGFDKSNQRHMLDNAFGGMARSFAGGFQTLDRWSGGLFSFSGSGRGLFGVFLVVLLIGAVIGVALVLRSDIGEGQGERSVSSSDRSSVRVARFYSEFLKLLLPFGLRRGKQQTAREFAEFVQQRFRNGLPGVDLITDCYYRARFRGEELPYEDLKRIKNELRAMKAQLREIQEKQAAVRQGG